MFSANYSPLLVQDPPMFLIQCPTNYDVFQFGKLLSLSGEQEVLFSLFLSDDSFLGLDHFFTYSSLGSLSMQVSPLWCCLLNSRSFWTLNSTSSTSSLLGSTRFSPPCTAAGHFSSGSKLGNQTTHLIYFVSLRVHCPLLSDIQYFENHCFIYSVQCFQLFQVEG